MILLAGALERVELAESVLAEAAMLIRQGAELTEADYARSAASGRAEPRDRPSGSFDGTIAVPGRGKAILPNTLSQRRYVESIRTHDLTFGIGPAGTGKTYLAMAMAVGMLLERRVKRIILTRPAVEAGEKLGFLPGDLAEKVNPYLRPLYDALHDMMDFEKADALVERGQIEVAPLAFMRGRTLNDAFVILDEAQNTTSEQMRMFLTRFGYGSRVVVTGDVTQVDLPTGVRSGLAESRSLLQGVDGISFCEFTDVDVVRHPLVQKIVLAYEKRDAERREAKGK
jgi:phosphate starvation-inducible PhoH-like protein